MCTSSPPNSAGRWIDWSVRTHHSADARPSGVGDTIVIYPVPEWMTSPGRCSMAPCDVFPWITLSFPKTLRMTCSTYTNLEDLHVPHAILESETRPIAGKNAADHSGQLFCIVRFIKQQYLIIMRNFGNTSSTVLWEALDMSKMASSIAVIGIMKESSCLSMLQSCWILFQIDLHASDKGFTKRPLLWISVRCSFQLVLRSTYCWERGKRCTSMELLFIIDAAFIKPPKRDPMAPPDRMSKDLFIKNNKTELLC